VQWRVKSVERRGEEEEEVGRIERKREKGEKRWE
jgi:hypothetical protein